MPLLGKNIKLAISVIFNPILTFFFLKCSLIEDKSNGELKAGVQGESPGGGPGTISQEILRYNGFLDGPRS